MAEKQQKKEDVQMVSKPEAKQPEVDFVQLVQDTENKAMGSSQFIRVKLPKDITTPGLLALNKAYENSGYEVFINGKHVLLLAQ